MKSNFRYLREAIVQDNHPARSTHQMPPQLLRHRSLHQPHRPLHQTPKETVEPQIIVILKIPCAQLEMTLLLLHPKRPKTANPVIKTIIQEEASQPPVSETYFEQPIVSPPAPPPVRPWSPESYECEGYAREISVSVFDAENKI